MSVSHKAPFTTFKKDDRQGVKDAEGEAYLVAEASAGEPGVEAAATDAERCAGCAAARGRAETAAQQRGRRARRPPQQRRRRARGRDRAR